MTNAFPTPKVLLRPNTTTRNRGAQITLHPLPSKKQKLGENSKFQAPGGRNEERSILGPTDIRCHRAKCSHHGNMAPGICEPLTRNHILIPRRSTHYKTLGMTENVHISIKAVCRKSRSRPAPNTFIFRLSLPRH